MSINCLKDVNPLVFATEAITGVLCINIIYYPVPLCNKKLVSDVSIVFIINANSINYK